MEGIVYSSMANMHVQLVPMAVLAITSQQCVSSNSNTFRVMIISRTARKGLTGKKPVSMISFGISVNQQGKTLIACAISMLVYIVETASAVKSCSGI